MLFLAASWMAASLANVTLSASTALNVSRICVDNSAGFVLHWAMRDLITDIMGPDSGSYPIDQTRCLPINTIAGVVDGHPILATVHAVMRSTVACVSQLHALLSVQSAARCWLDVCVPTAFCFFFCFALDFARIFVTS